MGYKQDNFWLLNLSSWEDMEHTPAACPPEANHEAFFECQNSEPFQQVNGLPSWQHLTFITTR